MNWIEMMRTYSSSVPSGDESTASWEERGGIEATPFGEEGVSHSQVK